ncbi:MAG: phosphohistidine phosphatase SixA [Nitrospirae bacterium]|nr:MAG: phosphohistidine phosphatase SixA [Nitrospirota bacterium]
MLFLIQHGEAMSEAEHPERPLTPRGRAEVQYVAELLARSSMPRPRDIWHSGKRRAAETAHIMTQALAPAASVQAVEGLMPNDDVQPMAHRLCRASDDLMIVGHLPFLSRLTSLLVAGQEEPALVRFRMGGVVALDRENERWVIVAVVTPELVRLDM